MNKEYDNLQDAFAHDNERGAHWLNNKYADDLSAQWPYFLKTAYNIEKERDYLRAEAAALRKDAERYRWLRSNKREISCWDGGDVLEFAELDAAIDAAIAATKEQQA